MLEQARKRIAELEATLERHQRLSGTLHDALKFYADPESYHAIAFMCDRPCGEFADDFGPVTHPHYSRIMPGKHARQTLQEAERDFGDLQVRVRE